MRPSQWQWMPTNPGRTSLLWPNRPQLHFTQLRSAPDVAVATNFVYTPTWARDFQGTMWWTNAVTTSLVNDLFGGSLTATQYSLSSHKTVQITPSFACKWAWWDGMLTSSTGMTITSWTQTTGLSLVLTCDLTHYSRPISTSCRYYASKTLPQPRSLRNRKICSTTAGYKSYNPTPLTRIPTPTTVKLMFWWSWWTIVMAFATYLTFPLRFGNFSRVTPSTSRSPHNALQVLQFSWAVYSFQGEHFASTIQSWNLPFNVKNGLQTLQIGILPVSGIHVMSTNLWYCKQHAQSHPCIRGHLCCPWIHDSFPLFSKQQHNH